MSNYENQAYAELKLWEAAMMKKPGLINRMAKGIQKGINNLIPEKVHKTITDVIKQMIRGVLFGSEKTSLKAREILSLEETEKAVKRSINIYKNTAAAEGGVTGAGGFLASLADFPLLISIKIKMLYDIAAKYGFDTTDYKERLYLLHIFELAFCSESKRAIIFQKMKNWDSTKTELPADIHQYDWRSLQQEYRDYIDLAKMAQMVPVIGAAVGLIANYKLLEKLGETAIQSYRMRILGKDNSLTT